MSYISPYSISVVIPAYNEEDYIEKCILHLEIELKRITDDFEIIVSNDGSVDNTSKILHSLKGNRPYLKIVDIPENKGIGYTLRSGFDLATKDVVFYSDADLPFDFSELARAIRVMHLKDAEAVTGFRHDRTSEGIKRIIYSLGYNILIRILFGVKIRDINFSFKLINRKTLQQMSLKSDGSFIDAEMIIKADKMELFICQIGIDYFKRKRGTSNLSSVGTILKILKELIIQYPSLIRMKQRTKKERR